VHVPLKLPAFLPAITTATTVESAAQRRRASGDRGFAKMVRVRRARTLTVSHSAPRRREETAARRGVEPLGRPSSSPRSEQRLHRDYGSPHRERPLIRPAQSWCTLCTRFSPHLDASPCVTFTHGPACSQVIQEVVPALPQRRAGAERPPGERTVSWTLGCTDYRRPESGDSLGVERQGHGEVSAG
jgi:hypothetical protein